MQSIIVAVLYTLLAVAWAMPNPTQSNPEDPTPSVTIKTCGGLVEASSALIEFQLGASIRADQHCVWVVRAPYQSLRFRLASSGLSQTDGLFVTDFTSHRPNGDQKVETVGQNYTVGYQVAIVTLAVGHAPTRGFSLEMFSSGTAGGRNFSGFGHLTLNNGNLSHPAVEGTPYQNNELALFVVNPTVPGQKTLRFTRSSLENDSGCTYDAVVTYNWFDNQYNQLARFCGSTLPASATLSAGVGLVSFVSDSSVTASGFNFEWI